MPNKFLLEKWMEGGEEGGRDKGNRRKRGVEGKGRDETQGKERKGGGEEGKGREERRD